MTTPTDTTTSTALEHLAEPAAVLPAPAGFLDDGFAESVPFTAVELRINRATGQFLLDGDSRPRTEVLLIPRGSHRAAQFFANRYDPKNPQDPSCQSLDGVTGYGRLSLDDTAPPRVRACATCPKRGFGAGYCSDLQRLLAWDIEHGMPVMTTLRNQEINPRKGVLTLAVNRFRSMGLAPHETVMRFTFAQVPNATYHELVIDVAPVRNTPALEEKLPGIKATLDTCWQALTASRQAFLQSLHTARP
jgi:hypothetical protein